VLPGHNSALKPSANSPSNVSEAIRRSIGPRCRAAQPARKTKVVWILDCSRTGSPNGARVFDVRECGSPESGSPLWGSPLWGSPGGAGSYKRCRRGLRPPIL
jgi:hypothetical protein